jgi:hypothetical protein
MNSMAKKFKTAVGRTSGIFRSVLVGAFISQHDDDYQPLSETPFSDDRRAIGGDYTRIQGDLRTAIEKVDSARTKDSNSGSKQGYSSANCISA